MSGTQVYMSPQQALGPARHGQGRYLFAGGHALRLALGAGHPFSAAISTSNSRRSCRRVLRNGARNGCRTGGASAGRMGGNDCRLSGERSRATTGLGHGSRRAARFGRTFCAARGGAECGAEARDHPCGATSGAPTCARAEAAAGPQLACLCAVRFARVAGAGGWYFKVQKTMQERAVAQAATTRLHESSTRRPLPRPCARSRLPKKRRPARRSAWRRHAAASN